MNQTTRLYATGTKQLPCFTPFQNGLLQRKSSSFGTFSQNHEQKGKLKKLLNLQSRSTDITGRAVTFSSVQDILRSPREPLDSETRAFMEPRFGYDFSKVQVHFFVPEFDQGQKIRHSYSGKSDCSPTWYGDTSPEVDPSGGSFTGKLVVKYNDTELKDPCVRECVELHESVHVKHLTPIVKKIRDCDVAAGKDWDKKEKCNEMATHELNKINKLSECEAYRKSFTCLTLKILDPSSPCSKQPHRDEVQKHRGYEGCEMKKYCAEAGTPEAGIPNV